MGDFKFSTTNSLANVSASINFTSDTSVITTSSSAYYTSSKLIPTITTTMQNDILNTETTATAIISSDKNASNANNNNNGTSQTTNKEQVDTCGINEKVMQNETSMSIQNAIPYTSESSMNVSPNVGGSSLWSTTEEQHISMNGISFPNFQSGGLFNGAPGLSSAHRRPVTATHNYQHPVGRSVPIPQNVFKSSYPTWSNPQPSAWPTGQNQNALASWNRGRSVPNLNPMHTLSARKPAPAGPATFHQHPVISPVKFRRSTSYPGKVQQYFQPGQQGPFETSVLDDMAYQVIFIF